jgi:ubiquinol-cytochrome c reductase cytochrome c subunit
LSMWCGSACSSPFTSSVDRKLRTAVSWITARRRRPVAGYAVVLLGLVLVGAIYATITGSGDSAASTAPTTSQAQIAKGRQIFQMTCATCHGLQAQGTAVAPSLIGVGSAAVDFQVSTGRMPAKEPSAENERKPPQLNKTQTRQVAAYIASLAGGPAIPTPAMVSTSGASVALGQELFTADCAQCHSFVGAGGALTDGKSAPPLTEATPTQIYEAMLTGPEAMPVFNNTTITPDEKRDIIAYVTQTRVTPNPGGFSLGRVGPVTEGLVAFLGLLFFMVLAAMWITAKHRKTATDE